MHATSPLPNGTILDKRYKILRELGRGGFGRTYLAEDTRRYNERCVLKEFAPQVTSSSELQKARELFEREAGTLYTLQHPQIPRFRELLPVSIGGEDFLFLVQDYVEGESYWQILNSRLQQGKVFGEAEVTQLLLQLLPVLEYIHSQNAIHRDISPDNLIQRSSDKLPILIDFGSVKQVAANAILQITGKPFGTAVGKDGYAPDEQMRLGKAYPSSDLYALAVTVLVLLTGKEPKNLYDISNGIWRWKQEVRVSQTLESVLDKMLAHRVRDRYQSAREVLQVLQPAGTPKPPHVTQTATQVVAPGGNKRSPVLNSVSSAVSQIATRFASGKGKPRHQSAPSQAGKLAHWRSIAKGMSVVLVPALVLLAVMKSNLFSLLPQISLPSLPEISLPLPSISLPPIPLPSNPVPSEPSTLTKAEEERQEKIYQRVKDLQLDEVLFYQQVDELFYEQHPELNRRSLSNNSEDAALRNQWYNIAEELLEQQQQGGGG